MTPLLFHLQPLWAIGYAMLLVVIATALERIAAHSHRRADQYHTGGFRFRKDSEHWKCPMGERLQMAETDHKLRVIRYQAPARACNGCSMKPDCN